MLAADVWKPPAVPQPSLARSPPPVRAASPAASASGVGGSSAGVAPAAAVTEEIVEEVPAAEQPVEA